jgi:hypothetical protein
MRNGWEIHEMRLVAAHEKAQLEDPAIPVVGASQRPARATVEDLVDDSEPVEQREDVALHGEPPRLAAVMADVLL